MEKRPINDTVDNHIFKRERESSGIMRNQQVQERRLVDKKGENQVSFKNLKSRFMKDFFTTMVDAKWFYIITACFASFFGLIYNLNSRETNH